MIQTLHLFRPLHAKLMEVLHSLDLADWNRQTVAGTWTVKDISAHLLDGSFRVISVYRDQWELPQAAITDYRSLVSYLNQLNAEWVTASKRLSPSVLMEWLDATHEPFVQCFEQLDPSAPARYSVAWAGEEVSPNWFHVAREYTERWHHQQQIREAVSKQGILTREFYQPVLDTFLMALPHAYRKTDAPSGTHVVVEINGESGGQWTIVKGPGGWEFSPAVTKSAEVVICIPADLAWKLFTKAVTPESGIKQVSITGTEYLAWPALRMLSVMA